MDIEEDDFDAMKLKEAVCLSHVNKTLVSFVAGILA